ncbi:MAG: type VI secretion system tube protein Hcp [Pseudomonadota bacterium]
MILLNFKTPIKGGSKVDGHADWIHLDSFQLGVGRSISVQSGGTDRNASDASFSEASVSKSTDIASADLFAQATYGKSLGEATLHFLQTGGAGKENQVFLEIVLYDVIISSYSLASGGDRPSESFSLNFTKISYQYNAFNGDKVTTGTAKKFDLMTNKTF